MLLYTSSEKPPVGPDGWQNEREEKAKVRAVGDALDTIKQVANVQRIANARVPIVKFLHLPTGLSCDVSFKNMMSVLNSRYTRFVSLKLIQR